MCLQCIRERRHRIGRAHRCGHLPNPNRSVSLAPPTRGATQQYGASSPHAGVEQRHDTSGLLQFCDAVHSPVCASTSDVSLSGLLKWYSLVIGSLRRHGDYPKIGTEPTASSASVRSPPKIGYGLLIHYLVPLAFFFIFGTQKVSFVVLSRETKFAHK
jgi:hypothetical protein